MDRMGSVGLAGRTNWQHARMGSEEYFSEIGFEEMGERLRHPLT
ncbi:MAG: hypothetical protein ACOYEQ_08465 [Bacillota bacterium]